MRKRNCRVEIYFTKDELESLTKKVRKSGLSRESFCRHLLNGAEIKEAPSADVPMLINEVRRVGYNRSDPAHGECARHARCTQAARSADGEPQG